MKNKRYLTRQDRLVIFKMRRLGSSIRQIAKEINKSHSTVSRELKRCGFELNKNSDYFEHTERAHRLAEERISRGRQREKLKSSFIRDYVEAVLKEKRWSPRIIAGRLTRLGHAISGEAIYKWIYQERRDLISCLWMNDKRVKRGGKKNKRRFIQPAAPKKSIELRPLDANQRICIGHFELDAILSSRSSNYALQVLVDRRSRKVFLQKVSRLEAAVYSKSLTARVHKDIPCIKTITSDNGGEHAEFSNIESSLNLEWYFCHPYCASERGTVENRNRIIRRFFPKGTNFNDIPDEYINWLEDYINHTPLEVLQFQTPDEVWNEGLKAAA